MNSFQLKLMAVILMILDHIGYFFPNKVTLCLRFIGRLSMPIFVFILVQGYIHTSNLKKYIKRISIFGLVMFFMNIILSKAITYLGSDIRLSPLLPNIFITMTLCLICLYLVDRIEEIFNKSIFNLAVLYLFLLIFTCIISIFVEYSLIPIILSLIFYKNKYNKRKMIFLYILSSIPLSIIFSNWVQCFMIFSIIPIAFYNNEKGYGKLKYFFYLFYPIHIYTLYFLTLIIK